MARIRYWETMVIVVGMLILLAPVAHAQWASDGSGICTAVIDQEYPTIIPDGEGGAILAWQDNRTGVYDIYAQRVDAYGYAQWTADGVLLCNAPDDQQLTAIASDGAGGAIVAWTDYRNRGSTEADIYVQRIDASGVVQWTTDGVAVCTAALDQAIPVIVSDGAGGAIVTWWDIGTPQSDIYAQRVDASGAVQWTTDGEALCTATGEQGLPAIVSDGVGGAIVVWEDGRSGDSDIYAQRIDHVGVARWDANGVALSRATLGQTIPRIVSDGSGGVIATWMDLRNGTDTGIFAQRVDASGTARWASDGVALCTATYMQYYPRIVSDGNMGAIVVWEDYRNGTDGNIFAQHIDVFGNVQWGGDGVSICGAAGEQDDPAIVADGSGGAIIVWDDNRGYNDIFAQRIDSWGVPQWTTDGITVCAAPRTQERARIVTDESGGAFITWQRDLRNELSDIFAQRVTRQGHWGYPAPTVTSVQDVPGDQGGAVRIGFSASRLDAWPEMAIYGYSIWRSMSPSELLSMESRRVPVSSPSDVRPELAGKAYYRSAAGGWEYIGSVGASLLPEYEYTATTLRDSTSADTGWEGYRVSADGAGQFEIWISAPDSGYSVDNLAPIPPAALAGQYTGGSQLWLHWNPNTEADLSHYAIYRGGEPGFVPSEANRLGTATDTTFTDNDFGPEGEFYYKVSAWDDHENESPHALLMPDAITGVPGGEGTYGNVLYQNVPNPFGSITSVAFSLEKAGRVSLKIFDAKGRLVRELVDEERAPSMYVEAWDGRDDSGRSVAAGTYFYRLELPGWSAVKKMTLAK